MYLYMGSNSIASFASSTQIEKIMLKPMKRFILTKGSFVARVVPRNFVINGALNCTQEFIQERSLINAQCVRKDLIKLLIAKLTRYWSIQRKGSFLVIFVKKAEFVKIHKSGLHAIERKHSCQYCSKRFKTRATFLLHLAVHQGADKRLSCDNCQKTFSLKASLTKHMQEIHIGEKNYDCEKCGQKFSRADTLRTHQAVHQSLDQRVSCKSCYKTFSLEASLRKHMKDFHEGEKKSQPKIT